MLTNTERQQIVEEVNAGTYGIDEALDDIAAAQKGEEVRKALYAEALVLNREGHAGSNDMIARQQIANLQTSVNGQISTLRTEVGDDIDDLETALNSGLATQNGKIAAQNATIANVVANYNVEYGSTELWASTGETGALAAGTTVTLSEDVSHFDYIDIYSFCGNSNVLDTVPVDAKLQSSQGYALRWVNLSDPDSGSYKAYVRIIETRLHIIGTTLTIDHQVTYRNGEEVNISGAEITQSNRSTYMGELGIMKVVGRKITANTEIEDVRIGADGTEYASAGQAVRGQITEVKAQIPLIDATLATAGKAADAKAVGNELTNVNDRLTQLDSTVNGETTQNYIEGKNLYANSVSHNIIDDENACVSDFIPVTWGSSQVTFWYTDDSADATVYQIWFFDENKEYLCWVSRNITGTNYRNITISAQAPGAAYARISFKKGFAGRVTEKSLTPSVIYYEAASTSEEGIVAKVGNLENLQTESKTNVVSAINDVVAQISGETATASFDHVSGAITDTLQFSALAGDTISVTPSGTAFLSDKCYVYFRYVGDSSNTNMGLVPIGESTEFVLTRDLSAIYLYSAATNSQAGTVVITATKYAVKQDIQKNADSIAKMNVLDGKKINFLGDSITHGPGTNNSNSFTTFLANEYGCVSRNYGIIGSTLQYDADRNPMCVRYADMDNDADIIAFMGGTNDYWYNKPLGTFGDTQNTTFYGALDVLISGLIAKYPTAFIYAVTPPHGYGDTFTGEAKSNSGSMQDIADAVKKVAGKYSLPVLDVFNAGGLYPKIEAQSLAYYNQSDGVHLTVDGQKKLASLHAAFIKAHA